MNAIEKIALRELENTIGEISKRILENDKTPERQVQHVLPFMKAHINKAFDIIEALKDNSN